MEAINMLAGLLSVKLIVLFIFISSVTYTQFRGKVRLKLLRQIVNHSTLMSPINAIMYLFSKVPNRPFIATSHFPELETLRKNWEVFRDEAQHLVDQGYIKATANHDDMGFNSFFKRGWKRFYVKWYGDYLPSAQLHCPKTVEILKSIPSIRGVMFTLLPKQGVLKPHRDPYAGSLRYHLGLITPNSDQCWINVDGVAYSWRDGEDVLFDETYIHSAKNDADIDRIILFCDIERPMNNWLATGINRFFSKYVLRESATQNLPIDRVGTFNKIYKYYYHVAHYILRLKKANKYIYRLAQYAGILGLLYLAFFRT